MAHGNCFIGSAYLSDREIDIGGKQGDTIAVKFSKRKS